MTSTTISPLNGRHLAIITSTMLIVKVIDLTNSMVSVAAARVRVFICIHGVMHVYMQYTPALEWLRVKGELTVYLYTCV